jgi:hypothetical protein
MEVNHMPDKFRLRSAGSADDTMDATVLDVIVQGATVARLTIQQNPDEDAHPDDETEYIVSGLDENEPTVDGSPDGTVFTSQDEAFAFIRRTYA